MLMIAAFLLVFNLSLHLLSGQQISLKIILQRRYKAHVRSIYGRHAWLFTTWYGALLPPVLLRGLLVSAIAYPIAMPHWISLVIACVHAAVVCGLCILHTRSVARLLPPQTRALLLAHIVRWCCMCLMCLCFSALPLSLFLYLSLSRAQTSDLFVCIRPSYHTMLYHPSSFSFCCFLLLFLVCCVGRFRLPTLAQSHHLPGRCCDCFPCFDCCDCSHRWFRRC